MSEHTHDAWIVGEHDLPGDEVEQISRAISDGNVVVHDLELDTWSVLTRTRFDRFFEWIV
jgi:hypothetical protein